MWGELALSFQDNNLYVLLILALAFIATIAVVERFIMLQFVYNIEFSKFLSNFKKMIISEDFDRAMNFCKSVSRTSLPKIALHALEAKEKDPTTIKSAIEEDTIEFLPRIENRIEILPAIATLIMLLGILGTIDELWWAFHSIDVLDTAKKQASLAAGIATSLNPTALGLIACMVVLACHQFLKSLAIRVVERIHHGVAVVHNLLVPPDVAVFPTAAAMVAQVPVQADTTDDYDEPESSDEGVGEDAFDDAAVEDIKDEEEII